MIGVHPARIPAILELAMKEIRAREREFAAAAILVVLEFLDSVIEENVRIVVTRCPACGGDEQARISCRKCRWPLTAYGPTGYAYPPTRRMAALGRINRLAWRRIRLLGLDKLPPASATGNSRPPKHSGPIADYLERSFMKELPARLDREDEVINDELAEFALERELLLTEALMREAAQIVLRKCEVCGGDDVQRTKCETCERTGYFYDPDRRLGAISRHGVSQDHRIKLLRLDKESPPRPASDPDLCAFFEMLQNASEEELETELETLIAGISNKPTSE